MTINSDKQKFKDMNVFQKLWKTLTDDLHRLTIILLIPVVVYGGFLINPDEIWLVITGSFVVTGVIGLLTDGEMFNDAKALAYVYNGIFVLIMVMWFIVAPIKIEKESMDLKPYITEIKANKDKTTFVINMKLPFESGIETSLWQSKYQPLFASEKHFEDFSITATKTCEEYRIKSVSCSVRMIINHKDVGESIYETSLSKSIYPKKFKLEIEEEKDI